MNFVENFKMAMDSIRANKMRSLLTMLGIIIGISSVITIVSLGQGGQNSIKGEFEKLGAATINVRVNSTKAEESDYITLEDVRQVVKRVDSVKYASPTVQKSGTIKTDTKSKRASITGASTEIALIENKEILYGRFYNERELSEGKSVAIIDEPTAKFLFGYSEVVGKTVKIGKAPSVKQVTIIGVTKGYEGAFAGMDVENMPAMIDVPITLLENLFPNDFRIGSISILATSKDLTEDAGNRAKSVLESRHNNFGKDIYTPESVLKQLDQINKVLGIFTAFIGAVAAISLIVGGIGVMNIMLVSVTERTREIGIRKAIGATTNEILIQFLTESVIITSLGGVIGMILGITGANIIGSFADITPSLSVSVILGAIAFSSAVGIFFGIYPARKAASLDPIEALRYE